MVTLDVPLPENFGNYLLTFEGFKKIVLPEVVSLAPQTIAAKVLVLCLALIVVYCVYRYYKRWMRNAYRRAALHQLKSSDGSASCQINKILKQATIVAFPLRARGALYGDDWLQFLNQTMNTAKGKFTPEMIQLLEREQYSGIELYSGDEMLQKECRLVAIQWMKHHREEKAS